MNRWNIPDDLEKRVLKRDTHCVYCGNELKQPPSSQRHLRKLGTHRQRRLGSSYTGQHRTMLRHV